MLEHIRDTHASVWGALRDRGNLGKGFPFISLYMMYAVSQHVEGFRILLDGGFDPMRLDVRQNAGVLFVMRVLNRAIFTRTKAPAFIGMLIYMAYGAVHCAAYFGLLPAVELVLEQKPELLAAPTHRKAGLRTPLHFAAIGNAAAVVTFLIARGAPVHVKDRYGKTPLYYARQFGHEEVAALLANSMGTSPVPPASSTGARKYQVAPEPEGGAK